MRNGFALKRCSTKFDRLDRELTRFSLIISLPKGNGRHMDAELSCCPVTFFSSDWLACWFSNHLSEIAFEPSYATDMQSNLRYSHYAMPADLTGSFHLQQSFAPPAGTHKLNGGVGYSSPAAAGPSHLRYDPYAPPRKAAPAVAAPSSPVKPSLCRPYYRGLHVN